MDVKENHCYLHKELLHFGFQKLQMLDLQMFVAKIYSISHEFIRETLSFLNKAPLSDPLCHPFIIRDPEMAYHYVWC